MRVRGRMTGAGSWLEPSPGLIRSGWVDGWRGRGLWNMSNIVEWSSPHFDARGFWPFAFPHQSALGWGLPVGGNNNQEKWTQTAEGNSQEERGSQEPLAATPHGRGGYTGPGKEIWTEHPNGTHSPTLDKLLRSVCLSASPTNCKHPCH